MLAIPSRALSDLQLVSAYVIFLASYLVFAIGKFPGLKINRPAAAMIGAVAMIACGAVSADDALRFIDFPTLVLLFSMMLIVGNVECRTSAATTESVPALAGGDLHDRISIRSVCQRHRVPGDGPVRAYRYQAHAHRSLAVPLAVATSSNIGSVATITGNPQNMLIGSFSRISYRDFFLHLGPVALVGLFLNWAVLYWLHMHRPGAFVTGPAKIPVPAHDPTSFRKPAVVVGVVVIGFFAGVPPAMMAALGAAALLITRTLEPKRLYDEVDWGLLVFFIGLFLIVGGAENVGIVGKLLAFAEHWNIQRLPPFLLTVSVLSNLVSNVPAVMLLKSLIPGFAHPRQAWLALAMSSTLAGNLTITGSVANIIVVERARPEVEIGFGDYLRAGLPITLATLLWGWGWLAWLG